MPGSGSPGKSWVDGPKGTATNGDTYSPEVTVTAQDAPNAAKLTGLGYVATPTSDWPAGHRITIGSYAFHWNGTAWVAGAHP